jgi:hypothetical protein
MPLFAPPVPYDPRWPRKLQVFGMPSMAIEVSGPLEMEPAVGGSSTLVSPVGRRIPAGGANRRYRSGAAQAASR